MHLEKLTADEIMKVNLPMGVPLVYEFDDSFNVISKQYLGDPSVIAAKINKVAAQGKKQRLPRAAEINKIYRTSRAFKREVLLYRVIV